MALALPFTALGLPETLGPGWGGVGPGVHWEWVSVTQAEHVSSALAGEGMPCDHPRAEQGGRREDRNAVGSGLLDEESGSHWVLCTPGLELPEA